MSIIYCGKHDRQWDSDNMSECPRCENELDDKAMDNPYQQMVEGNHSIGIIKDGKLIAMDSGVYAALDVKGDRRNGVRAEYNDGVDTNIDLRLQPAPERRKKPVRRGHDMKPCTWVGCTETAAHPQLDRNGAMWANLCLHHHAELAESIAASIPKMLSAWVKAKGGAKKAAEAM